jgi:Cytochrome C oxidase, cbb3-type, subunit III
MRFRRAFLAYGKVSAATPDELRKMIVDGKAHMPKFGAKLSAEEIETLVQQIRSFPTK